MFKKVKRLKEENQLLREDRDRLQNSVVSLMDEVEKIKEVNKDEIKTLLGQYPGPNETEEHGINYKLLEEVVEKQVESRYHRMKLEADMAFRSKEEIRELQKRNDELQNELTELHEKHNDLKIKYLEVLRQQNE